jgi:hypothetical protein
MTLSKPDPVISTRLGKVWVYKSHLAEPVNREVFLRVLRPLAGDRAQVPVQLRQQLGQMSGVHTVRTASHRTGQEPLFHALNNLDSEILFRAKGFPRSRSVSACGYSIGALEKMTLLAQVEDKALLNMFQIKQDFRDNERKEEASELPGNIGGAAR